jgi:hypothetical protein
VDVSCCEACDLAEAVTPLRETVVENYIQPSWRYKIRRKDRGCSEGLESGFYEVAWKVSKVV